MMHSSKARIVAKTLELLSARAADATICPSEVARALDAQDWRALMPMVRSVAAELAHDGTVEVRQRGKVIALTSETRGPIRIAMKAK